MWNTHLEFYEYSTAANPSMPPIRLDSLQGQVLDRTEVATLDLSEHLQTGYRATSPVCLASFVYIRPGASIVTQANATSHLFVVVTGKGETRTPLGDIPWAHGDVLAIPACDGIIHHATESAVLYWVNDEPLLNYLGVVPHKTIFPPTHYPHALLAEEMAKADGHPQASHRNRNGVLLGSPACPLTHTVTPTLWSLYNTIHPGQVQTAHRHQSVALDLCLTASPGVYTLMGQELDPKGNVLNPQRADWTPGSMFITPPGWWHSHHNESREDARVFPVQDAGLQLYMRTLDIRFAGGGPNR
jgi:gentisate 1,2-dioxygenase